MRRALLAVWGMVVGMFVFTGVVSAADYKFAYVDITRVFSDYNKTKEYDKLLGSKEDGYTKDREKRVAEIKQYQDKLSLLSDKEKAAKKTEFESKLKVLQDFDREKQTDLRKEQDDKMKEILKDIEDVVKKYAEKEGVTFVFNDRVLVYQDKKLDISDKIIEELNKTYKPK